MPSMAESVNVQINTYPTYVFLQDFEPVFMSKS